MEFTTMANKLTDARRSLIRAQEAAQKRLEEIENERREIKASLKSLDAALKALGGSAARAASNQPLVSNTDRSGGAAATDAL
jgi:hypothetical protein